MTNQEGLSAPVSQVLPSVLIDNDGDEWKLNADDGMYTTNGLLAHLAPADLGKHWGPLTLPGTPFSFKTTEES